MTANPPNAPCPKKKFPLWILVLLVVVGVMVVFIGILSALAIHGFTKYMKAAKTSEAKATVGMIAKSASAAFERELVANDGNAYHAMCPSASNPVPQDIARVRGVKYQSNLTEWDVDRAMNRGFACLGFSMANPQYYQYDYQASGSPALDRFQAIARGDLNGDGVTSSFVLEGRLANGVLLLSPTIVESSPEE
ncbi:MAG TPA: type II secretion system protein [Polyangiaceae bacterium]|jgi:type IV pilus assembly protein PilA|nr:MAG: hypothetical protein BWY17_02155 [Deltaproteobacteria bacterium ADurb.Bin207]HNS98277.1 type II secretion system protein [Polyangiaceae bacterium]HNZ22085.1 type II secretion system protein [Polyangiaceae bacterium]HOD25444.1 type II secretion system protein [Polyangiaceae bacterium]HOE47393.1 type II secretion system protein [Polyangiaceae bacterium]